MAKHESAAHHRAEAAKAKTPAAKARHSALAKKAAKGKKK